MSALLIQFQMDLYLNKKSLYAEVKEYSKKSFNTCIIDLENLFPMRKKQSGAQFLFPIAQGKDLWKYA